MLFHYFQISGVTISGDITFNLDSAPYEDPPRFTLTCITTGGPATTVTWTINSDNVNEGIQSVLDDAVSGRYIHNLTLTRRQAGRYRFSVHNKISSGNSQKLVSGIASNHMLYKFYNPCAYILDPLPPNTVHVSQNGLDGVRVSWRSSRGSVNGYIIYYRQQPGGQRMSQAASQTATSARISGLTPGVNYSIEILSISSTLPSTLTPAQNIHIGNTATR